jgi:glyoxylase-like metal-dependent hydrolase (beta-lactamase superfamily II)
VKADLYSTVLMLGAGLFVIDPITPEPEAFQTNGENVCAAGVIVTNENHVRASFEAAERLRTAVYADPAAAIAGTRALTQLGLPDELAVIPLPGAPRGEIALHCSREGGTLIIGDALINFGSDGFAFLPAKYCGNARQMRRSLRKLLDYDFERILFAHGSPICSNARGRLAALFDNEQ